MPRKPRNKQYFTKDTEDAIIEYNSTDNQRVKDRVYSTTRAVKKNYGRNDLIVMKSKDGEMIEVKYKNANKYFLQGYEVV